MNDIGEDVFKRWIVKYHLSFVEMTEDKHLTLCTVDDFSARIITQRYYSQIRAAVSHFIPTIEYITIEELRF
jgi:hypothetical protein